jgi:excisionase family DNA binding protein
MPQHLKGLSARASQSGAPPDEVEGLLDIAAAAAYLGVNETFIRRLVLERRVRYYKVGKFVRFLPADLRAFVLAGTVDPQPSPGAATTHHNVGRRRDPRSRSSRSAALRNRPRTRAP